MKKEQLNPILVRRLADRFGRLQRMVAAVITPVYRRGPRGHPEAVGTGVVLSIDGKAVLATAAHVSDLAAHSRLHLGVAGEIEPIDGSRVTSPLPASGRREDDNVDLAFWRLNDTQARRIPRGDMLDVKLLDAAHNTPPFRGKEDHFIIFGYPVSRQPRQPMDDTVEARPLSFVARSLSKADYLSAGRDPRESLLLEYDKANSFSLAGPTVGPDLPGLSGGSVWYYPGLLAEQRGRPILAGIATTWRLQPPKCIIAARLGPLIKAIRHSGAQPPPAA